MASLSHCTDYQARRLNIRYQMAKTPKGKASTEYVHTLNGTALAIPRILIALIEQHQDEAGIVHLPRALHPYCSFKTIQ